MPDVTAVIPLTAMRGISKSYLFDYLTKKFKKRYTRYLIVGSEGDVTSSMPDFKDLESITCVYYSEDVESLDFIRFIRPYIKTKFYHILDDQLQKITKTDGIHHTTVTDKVLDLSKSSESGDFIKEYNDYLELLDDSDKFMYPDTKKVKSGVPWARNRNSGVRTGNEPVDDPSIVAVYFMILGLATFLIYIAVYIIFGVK